ncbi:hypothetical protein Tco_1329148 [Tanacetum coccineum]
MLVLKLAPFEALYGSGRNSVGTCVFGLRSEMPAHRSRIQKLVHGNDPRVDCPNYSMRMQDATVIVKELSSCEAVSLVEFQLVIEYVLKVSHWKKRVVYILEERRGGVRSCVEPENPEYIGTFRSTSVLSDEPLAVPLDETKEKSFIPIIKVRWNSKRVQSSTWGREDKKISSEEVSNTSFTKTTPSKNVAI